MANPIFLNNNVSNVILEENAVYEVSWPKGHHGTFSTILKFYKQFANGYCFIILCEKHLEQYNDVRMTNLDNCITYGRDDLRSARFKRSAALDVLYGSAER